MTLKVKELIEQLQKCDQEMPVYLCDLNDDTDEGGNLKEVISADANECCHEELDENGNVKTVSEIVVFINFEQ